MNRTLRTAAFAASFLAFAAMAQAPAAKKGAAKHSPSSVLDMADKLDAMDQQDFLEALNEAESCTRARNFSCSEEKLRKAAKVTTSSKDKLALNTATRNLQDEKKRVKDETLAREEQVRRIQLAEARRQADAKRAAKQRQDEADEAEEAEERREAASERARQRASEDDDTPSVNPYAAALNQAADLVRELGAIQRDSNAATNAAINAAKASRERDREAASARAEKQRLERVAEIERRNEGIRARNVEIARENKQLLEDSRRRQGTASARQAEHAQAAQQAKVVQQRAQDDEQRQKEAKAQIAAQQRASNTLNQQMQQQANQQAYDSAQAARQPKAMQPDVIASNSAAGGNTKEKPKKTLKNPGESANLCLTATSLGTEKRGSKDTNQIEITNNCGQDVFVLYCGDLWATSRRCGSSPKSYYTHSSNLGPNKSTDFNVLANGSYQYAGCMGGISFGNDGEYRDEGSGSISCLPR